MKGTTYIVCIIALISAMAAPVMVQEKNRKTRFSGSESKARKPIAVFMTFLMLATAFAAVNYSIVGTAEAADTYTKRGPIFVYGDDDFTAENGVTCGNGTENDPFIIEGWEMDTSKGWKGSIVPGITIRNTRAHVVIRNNYIHGVPNERCYGAGIYIAGEDIYSPGNSTNITISNNRIENNSCYGIYMYGWCSASRRERAPLSNITISNNRIESNSYEGISVDGCSYVTISDNRIKNDDIWMYGNSHCTISNHSDVVISRLRGSHYTVFNNSVTRLSLETGSSKIFNNTIENGSGCTGLWLGGSYNEIFNNTIRNIAPGASCSTCGSTGNGIWLHSCGYNEIYSNTIENCSGHSIGLCYHCSNNLIYNNYLNSTKNYLMAAASSSKWYTEKTNGSEVGWGENIIGGDWWGGNYWSGYTGADGDGDGLGDYQIPYGPGDYHPLTEPNYNAPDLTPTAITAPPLFVNLTSTITAAIENIGTADASAFSVSLSAGGSVVNTASVPSLGAGSLTNVSFSWTPASAGDYDLCVVADTDDAIDETDETNNATCTIVTVSEVSAEIVWQHGALIPWDAERLSSGNTLIAEYGNHTVIEVTPAGETVWLYGTGTAGSGANELNSPAAAERLTGGNTLIVDRNNHRVIEVDPAGGIVWQYGTTGVSGSGANELYNPMDAERLSNGNTLIADRLNNRVIEVTPTGGISWEITGLNHPFDAARLPDGNTLVVEYKNHRVIEMTPAGEVVWQYGTGTPGSGVNELNFPTDAERLSNGDTLIVDAMNDRVITVRTSDYDPARANNGFITRSIVWEYGSNYPVDAERLSNGNTLIAEANNDRVIEVVTPAAELKSSTPFMIFGEVNHDIDEPILNLNVTVGNMDTTGDFDVDIYVSDNRSCYQVVTASGHILAGDTLHFCASDDNTTEFNHIVTAEEMDNGGFVQNITIVSPIVWMPDLTVTAINAYHNDTRCPAWFNLSNEVDVTIENTGTTPANESDVSLYIDGVFFGKLPVPSMAAGASETATFTGWMPIGEDCLQAPCEFAWSSRDYNFMGVADCDNDVAELDEANNEITVVDRACYNGYMADDPLENVAHGMLNGGVLFTTGDSRYTGLYTLGSSVDAHYDITLPEGAGVELAHLNVYYTWHYELDTCPQMEVSITNAAGTHIVPLKKSYNDHKCTCPGAAWVFPWGNYVYDLTDYIQDSGSYTVTVTRTGGPSFCVAARGINLVYEDQNASQIEYWINEGADILMGGRRYPTSSNLAWWENINNATFPASTEAGVVNATLGVVSPWAGSSWDPGMTNYLFFNDVKLGTGAYHGYTNPYSETIDGITMDIGHSDAQVGVNVTSVTDLYLEGSDNVVGQCDDGDNMMPCNAFLVVEYGGEEMIPAGVRIEPEVLNLGSKGDFTAHITLPEDYDVAEIDLYTVICEGAPADSGTVAAADNGTLVTKFDRVNLSDDLPTGEVEMTVTGNLFDGTPFGGSDTVTLTHGVEPTPPPTPTPPPMGPGYWVSDSNITSGLGDVGYGSTPTVFYKDETWYLIAGNFESLGKGGEFHGWSRTGSAWQSDPAITSGLPDIGNHAAPTVFYKDGTWYLISGEFGGAFYGFNWTGSAWQSDPAITSGLEDVGYMSGPTVFCMDGTWYLIAGEGDDTANEFYGFKWTGSTWESDRAIVSGLRGVSRYTLRPAVFNTEGAWYLIAGEYDGAFYGWRWTGHNWQSDDNIVLGLVKVGYGHHSAPTVFNKDGTWYLITGDNRGAFYGFRWQDS